MLEIISGKQKNGCRAVAVVLIGIVVLAVDGATVYSNQPCSDPGHELRDGRCLPCLTDFFKAISDPDGRCQPCSAKGDNPYEAVVCPCNSTRDTIFGCRNDSISGAGFSCAKRSEVIASCPSNYILAGSSSSSVPLTMANPAEHRSTVPPISVSHPGIASSPATLPTTSKTAVVEDRPGEDQGNEWEITAVIMICGAVGISLVVICFLVRTCRPRGTCLNGNFPLLTGTETQSSTNKLASLANRENDRTNGKPRTERPRVDRPHDLRDGLADQQAADDTWSGRPSVFVRQLNSKPTHANPPAAQLPASSRRSSLNSSSRRPIETCDASLGGGNSTVHGNMPSTFFASAPLIDGPTTSSLASLIPTDHGPLAAECRPVAEVHGPHAYQDQHMPLFGMPSRQDGQVCSDATATDTEPKTRISPTRISQSRRSTSRNGLRELTASAACPFELLQADLDRCATMPAKGEQVLGPKEPVDRHESRSLSSHASFYETTVQPMSIALSSVSLDQPTSVIEYSLPMR